MHTKNVFTQKDPIADLVKPMLEAQTTAKMEELKGNQKVLDKNKNNKLDAQDFKILRGEKKANEEVESVEENAFDWKKPREPEVKGGSGVKKGRAYGGAAQKSKPEQDDADDKKMKKEEVEQVDEASYSAKAAAAGKDIGKPGKMFGKIAKKAAGRYGSMVKGKKVAGALLAKLRKEETDYEPLLINQIMEDTLSEIDKLDEEIKNEILSLVEGFVSATPEQLNELSPDTEYSYFKKALAQQKSGTIPAGKKKQRAAGIRTATKRIGKRSAARLSDAGHGNAIPAGEKAVSKSGRPYWGEDVEGLEERTLTAGETAKKEKIVKGMKKNLSGFKSRYGDKAKSVMYATATKAAKKD